MLSKEKTNFKDVAQGKSQDKQKKLFAAAMRLLYVQKVYRRTDRELCPLESKRTFLEIQTNTMVRDSSCEINLPFALIIIYHALVYFIERCTYYTESKSRKPQYL